MLRFLAQEWKYFVSLLLVIVVLGIGYYEYRQWREQKQPQPAVMPQPNIVINTLGEKAKPDEPQIVYIQGETKTAKEIVYVEKGIDPKTGLPEKTDVEFERRQGKIYVKVNGKEFEVPAEVKEDAKFDKGKLVITEQTQLRVDIRAPKPRFNLGVGWSINGPAAQINGSLYKNVSWWVYGDKETVAGGVQFPIMR